MIISIYVYVKNDLVSGPDKTLKGWDSKEKNTPGHRKL